MKVKDLVFEESNPFEDDILFTCKTEFGRITILDRMTGFSWGRDTETGFKDNSDLFWLASGNFDIRLYPESTIEEAIKKIKENANTCIPSEDNK